MKAATQLASGHPITAPLVINEIVIFLLMKEFGGTPSQWESQSPKNIKFITTILSTYNKISNDKIKRDSKVASTGGRSKRTTGRFRREERVGPNGTEIVDIPI